MRTKLLAVGMVVILVSTTFGVNAFTSAKMSRESNINVVADNNGLIALQDGTPGDFIQLNSSGALTIDLSKGSADGPNVHAYFEFGNKSDPHNNSAFNITNQDTQTHSFTLDYTGESTSDGEGDVKFLIYKPSATSATKTLTEDSGAVTIDNVASGDTLHVVLVIDTEADKGDDHTGHLNITA